MKRVHAAGLEICSAIANTYYIQEKPLFITQLRSSDWLASTRIMDTNRNVLGGLIRRDALWSAWE